MKRRKFLGSTELLAQEEGDAMASMEDSEEPKKQTLKEEWQSVALLVALYMVQGVPLGLSMGSMPFLMQSRVSYTQIGLFSLASYPYSFKLLWSPVVDSVYCARFGRRKSWIVPLQLLSGLAMVWWGGWVERRLDAGDAAAVTTLFFGLVLLAATQDIAVDGWALTLLSKHNLGYASTCQTVGMNCGYFLSFTIFLALSDPSFCNKYFRPEGAAEEKGILTLSGYLRFWGWVYVAFTLGLALLKSEGRARGSGSDTSTHSGAARTNGGLNGSSSSSRHARSARKNGGLVARPSVPLPGSSSGGGGARDAPGDGYGSSSSSSDAADQPAARRRWQERMRGDGDYGEEEEVLPLKESYLQLWRVVRLPAVRQLAAVLVSCRLGMLAAEAVAPLKLLEKGATKEALAGLVLITFPTELVSAVVAGRWATSPHPFTPWLGGYRLRLLLAALSTLAVYRFPRGAALFGDAPASFAAVAAIGVATSFSSTLMFTALGSFYNRVSDPSIGGAYLTLLNTIANLGITLPKVFIFAAMDWLTVRECRLPEGADPPAPGVDLARSCGQGGTAGGFAGHNACTEAGGTCDVLHDGFYRLSVASVLLGALMLVWLQRVLPRLERLPLSAWRSRRPAQD